MKKFVFPVWVISVGKKVVTILETLLESVRLQLADVRKLIATVLIGVLVADAILVGKLGVVSFLNYSIITFLSAVGQELKLAGPQLLIMFTLIIVYLISKSGPTPK